MSVFCVDCQAWVFGYASHGVLGLEWDGYYILSHLTLGNGRIVRLEILVEHVEFTFMGTILGARFGFKGMVEGAVFL
jgi:hypothetical protein